MSNKTQLQTNNASLDRYISRIQAAKEVAATLPEAGGVDLPELTNEGFASDLMLNKELIDSDGNVITGTFTIDNELTTQDNLIAQIQAAVDGLPEAGSGSPDEGNNFPYTITVNNNMNLNCIDIFYNNTLMYAIIVMPGALGPGNVDSISGAIVSYVCCDGHYSYYMINNIRNNIVLNLTFANPN